MQAYLDNSATTRPTPDVIEKMAACMRDGFYNPSSPYGPAIQSERALNACRTLLAKALCVQADGILFTSGGTEANNLAILGALAAMRGPRHVVTDAGEHPSVLACFERLKADGHRVSVLGLDEIGEPDWPELARLAAADPPSLVSFMQVNNETGATPDLARMRATLRAAAPDCLIHVDGVQGFLRLPFDARDVDLYTLSAHKLHGPKGVGALYVRKGVRLLPRQLGGDQEGCLRAGTENTPGIAGLMEAARALAETPDLERALRARKLLFTQLVLEAVPEARINGPNPKAGAPHILNVSLMGVRAEVMLHALEAQGVYCSAGAACSTRKRKLSPVLLAMGLSPQRAECALRFSLSPHTSEEELRYAAEQIGRAHAALKRYQRRS